MRHPPDDHARAFAAHLHADGRHVEGGAGVHPGWIAARSVRGACGMADAGYKLTVATLKQIAAEADRFGVKVSMTSTGIGLDYTHGHQNVVVAANGFIDWETIEQARYPVDV